ncbi:GntR domain protein [Candidatus Vecturithrix granuli]|uniref:GntR domain protein n=1 Tax=Vecturithrix granuli TaxID=1499967 RepID=A0A081C803_VECG1|nr:GntR domain protein [Candidatus Vecturithrix granuli]
MKQRLDNKELMILQSISSSKTPIGSWYLVQDLEKKGIKIGSATIGRMLVRLEKFGYLEKVSFRGRKITKKGLDTIAETETIKKIDYHKQKLDRMITTEVLENFIMVLEARKAIEKETARLAARNITDQEIEALEAILEQQEGNSSKGISIAQDDIDFHRTIAKASKNLVFEALYNIISTYNQQSELFEKIRRQVKTTYNVSHRKIFHAIKQHDEAAAEHYMVEHLQNLIKDVSNFWDEYYGKSHDIDENACTTALSEEDGGNVNE